MKATYVGDCNVEGIRLQGKNEAKGETPASPNVIRRPVK